MTIIIFIMVIGITTLVGIGTSNMIKNKLKSKQNEEELRKLSLSKSEEGQKALIIEKQEIIKKIKKLAPKLRIYYIVCYSLLVLLGIAGIILFILDYSKNNQLGEIILNNKGFYILYNEPIRQDRSRWYLR